MRDEFVPSSSYSGSKEGYVFKTGVHGLGYYKDVEEVTQSTSTRNFIYEFPVISSPYNAATAIATPPVTQPGPAVKYYDRSIVFPNQGNIGKTTPNVSIFPFFNCII